MNHKAQLIWAKVNQEPLAQVEVVCVPPAALVGGTILIRRLWWGKWFAASVSKITQEKQCAIYHLKT